MNSSPSKLKKAMTRQEAMEKIEAILVKQLALEPSRAQYIAERIYVEVIAPAVDDERTDWLNMSRRAELLDS